MQGGESDGKWRQRKPRKQKMQGPKKVRRCAECKRVFANPESFRVHRIVGGRCRTEDELKAKGYVESGGKWINRIKP